MPQRQTNARRKSSRPRTDPLGAAFAALADPTRRAMLEALAERDLCVSELAEPFAISLPAVSKHLKVLERAGLVRRSQDAQWRPCRLDAEVLKPAVEWLGQFALLWEARFERSGEWRERPAAKRKKRRRRPA